MTTKIYTGTLPGTFPDNANNTAKTAVSVDIAKLLLYKLLTIIVFIFLVVSANSCGDDHAATVYLAALPSETCVVVGIDQSESVEGYRRLDTGFVAEICHRVGLTGGVAILYGIGDPTNQSGLRCYLRQLPKMDHNLVLSRQAELKRNIIQVEAKNEKKIYDLLIKAQVQIFETGKDPGKKINNTDINGFFRKASELLDEPDIQKMRRYLFCYSDGIQSINSKDSPASFKFRTKKDFTLCLAGWKSKSPSDSVSIIKFEDPLGFLKYLGSQIQ